MADTERVPVAVVTGGGGRELASGLCEALWDAGYRLAIVDADGRAATETADRYPGSLALRADVRQPDDVGRVFDEVFRAFGRVDGLVNNAGVGLEKGLLDVDEVDFDLVFDTSVRGSWLMARELARRALADGTAGAVVNVSSVHANRSQLGYWVYAGAKSAVEGMTRGLALELGRWGIRCNAVAPGAVFVEEHARDYGLAGDDPIGWIREHARWQQSVDRVLRPVDVGRVVAFLLSDASWAISGQTLVADAGLLLSLYGDVRGPQIYRQNERSE